LNGEVTIMQYLLVLLILVAGASIAVQPVINATAAAEMGHPLWGALVSAAVTFLALAAAIVAIRLPLPVVESLRGFPTWFYGGGLIGAFMLFAALLAAPRLGVATTAALIIAGQLAAALAIDQFGWLGVPQHPISGLRALGALCLLAGVTLIRS
jgi:bacterial/archaeal transporter family-2 protein